MKLYAVCVKANMNINGIVYPERWNPVSKLVAGNPAEQEDRGPFKYAPAIFTSARAASKLCNTLIKKAAALGVEHRLRYAVIPFDSGEIAYPPGFQV